jgi:hypothetical protein
MTVPKLTETTPTTNAPEALPALPPKRARRRSTRPSHSWCFRKPPSRKRVELSSARGVPEMVLAPVQGHQPIDGRCN